MPRSILVFDFGADEESAQQARHKIEAWKQGFRLGDKMLLKFERESPADTSEKPAEPEGEEADPASTAAAGAKPGKKKSTAKSGAKAAKSGAKPASKFSAEPAETPKEESAKADNAKVRLLLRLNFSEHEKLSHQRWLDRIPAEEPFKSASAQTVRTGDPDFSKTDELFESLD